MPFNSLLFAETSHHSAAVLLVATDGRSYIVRVPMLSFALAE
jgi:hypothetical protein